MFNMDLTELLLVGVIALVVIGPKQLPEVARTLARFLNQLRSATDDVKATFRDVQSDAQAGLGRWRETLNAEETKINQALNENSKPNDTAP